MRPKVFLFIFAPPPTSPCRRSRRNGRARVGAFFRAKTRRQLTSAAAKKDAAAPKRFLAAWRRRTDATRRDVGWSWSRKKVGRQPIGGRRRFPERKREKMFFFRELSPFFRLSSRFFFALHFIVLKPSSRFGRCCPCCQQGPMMSPPPPLLLPSLNCIFNCLRRSCGMTMRWR